MSHYKPYPAYKDSGVEWLGRVPEHWGICSFKRVANICYGIGEPPGYKPEGTPLIRATNVDAGKIRSEGLVYVDPAEIPERRAVWLAPGDIIVVRSGAYTGDSAIVRQEHCPSIAGFDMVIRAHDVDPDFLQYALLSNYLKSNQIDLEKMRAAQPHLNAEELGACFVLLPSGLEQKRIVVRLDHETARIDALIEKKTRFIELLREKRQALISHAVTKGLDPNVKMKDSGVEWLGEVPEHWIIRSFKHLSSVQYGIGEPPAYKSDGVPLIRATNVDAGRISSAGLVYVDPEDIPVKRIVWLAPGDIIVVRSGAYTGDSAVIREHHCPAIAGFDMVISTKCINANFLQYALLSSYLKLNQIDLEKMRAAQPHLNAEELGSCFVLVPTGIEQEEIVNFLDSSTAHVDGLINKTFVSINLLRERRSALITAAVTGQIDLRESA